MKAHRNTQAHAQPIVEVEYRPTTADSGKPAAGFSARTWVSGFIVFCLTAGALAYAFGLVWFVFPIAIAAAFVVIGAATFLSTLTGNTNKHAMVSGATTAYTEQYSYQQTLVMRGDLDAALASFESVIASKPRTITARVKAAELYTRDKKNHLRAAELFREIQKIPAVSAGDYVYATNRLVDLLAGPLNESGKARMELRKLMDKFPDTPAAANARLALNELRSRETPE